MSTRADPPILLTGAAGFVGFHTAKALTAAGYTVVGIDNLNDYYDPQLKRDRLARLAEVEGFSFHRLDLADREGMAALFDASCPRAVVHLGAQAGVRYSIENPFAYVDSNLVGTMTVLEGCRRHGVAHLVYASSSSVYGANRKVPFAESDPVDHPVSLYAATKRADELMAHTYSHLYGLPTTGLRFFTVYGPWGRPDMAYYKFAKAIREERPIELYNGGEMARDFTYVDDVVTALVRLVETPAAGAAAASPDRSHAPFRLFNVGNHTPVRLQDFVASLERCLGQKATVTFAAMQPGDVVETFAAVDGLAATVDFAPSTPLERGLAAFVDWFDAYHGYA